MYSSNVSLFKGLLFLSTIKNHSAILSCCTKSSSSFHNRKAHSLGSVLSINLDGDSISVSRLSTFNSMVSSPRASLSSSSSLVGESKISGFEVKTLCGTAGNCLL
ncbi:unnamed protein product [Mucor hiemalis]